LQSVITAAAVYVTAAVFTISTAAVSTASAVITAAAVYVTATAFTVIAAASIITVTTAAVVIVTAAIFIASTATAVFTATAVISVYSASASNRSPHSVSSVRPWSYHPLAPFPQSVTNT
jgi:hypothetical protein